MRISESDKYIIIAAQGADIEGTLLAVQTGSLFIKVGQFVTKIALKTPCWIVTTLLLARQCHLMVICAAGHSRIQLLLRLPLSYLNAKSLQSLVGLLAVVADKAEGCFMSFEDSHLGERHDFIAFVDLLVDDVPNIDVWINVAHERVREEVVEQRFCRHELVGIDKNNDDGLLTLQQVLQLRSCLQIFHYYYADKHNALKLTLNRLGNSFLDLYVDDVCQESWKNILPLLFTRPA